MTESAAVPFVNGATETLSVVVERDVAFPPEKIWRALTQPHLMAEWLMKSDFKAVVDHRFRFTADWGAVDCQVRIVEPNRTLSYSWGSQGLDSVVTWTLTPTGTGTHLRMEQVGFTPGFRQAYHGAKAGWPRFLAKLEQVLATAADLKD
ncbi:SRPBCC domain-containing protein [soil metagenome]